MATTTPTPPDIVPTPTLDTHAAGRAGKVRAMRRPSRKPARHYIGVLVPLADHRKLRDLCAAADEPLSKLVRRAVREFLDRAGAA
jgi:hypothetical protein